MPQTANTPTEFNKKAAWNALWALVIGFFMILLDTTIVHTAMPAIMEDLDADISSILWINSAYLLTFAVPLLVTGRLGDRFGPRNIYLLGMVIFTIASLWSGLSTSLASLILARAVQGLGAALISPQSMTMITRLFPYAHRGAAMGVWGAVAGIASLVGPIAGGLLVDSAGWEWIFFINIPIAVVSIAMVLKFVPKLKPQAHSFDW
ncbi:MFS transporter, partial [Glutamicibacter soli]